MGPQGRSRRAMVTIGRREEAVSSDSSPKRGKEQPVRRQIGDDYFGIKRMVRGVLFLGHIKKKKKSNTTQENECLLVGELR